MNSHDISSYLFYLCAIIIGILLYLHYRKRQDPKKIEKQNYKSENINEMKLLNNAERNEIVEESNNITKRKKNQISLKSKGFNSKKIMIGTDMKEDYKYISEQNINLAELANNYEFLKNTLKCEIEQLKSDRDTSDRLNYFKDIEFYQQINILKRQNNIQLNAYKILYFRKISNIILKNILIKHNSSFYKTNKIFKDPTKPDYKRNSFAIIIAKEKIGKVEIKRVNLAIDFLMFVKDSSSSFIHLVEKYPIQVEILYNIFEEKKIEKDEGGDYVIDSDEFIHILFKKGMNT